MSAIAPYAAAFAGGAVGFQAYQNAENDADYMREIEELRGRYSELTHRHLATVTTGLGAAIGFSAVSLVQGNYFGAIIGPSLTVIITLAAASIIGYI